MAKPFGIAPNVAWSDKIIRLMSAHCRSFLRVCVPRIAARTLHKLDCENAQRTQPAKEVSLTQTLLFHEGLDETAPAIEAMLCGLL